MTTVLEKIRAEPQKLSSPKLFSEATEALAEARTLQPGGTRLSGHIEAVAGLLQQYTEPVDLVITSDGKTDIMLSSVGRLGTFATRTVNLRPGEYTLVGSQQGCRDVRKNIIVGPSTNTVTIACSETVSQ